MCLYSRVTNIFCLSPPTAGVFMTIRQEHNGYANRRNSISCKRLLFLSINIWSSFCQVFSVWLNYCVVHSLKYIVYLNPRPNDLLLLSTVSFNVQGTISMIQCFSCKVGSYWLGQELPPFMEIKSLLQCFTPQYFDSILNQFNLFNPFISYSSKPHFSNILHLHLISLQWSFPWGSSNKIHLHFSFSLCLLHILPS
jgi:hypothetical protein